jgi:hypothetical protein
VALSYAKALSNLKLFTTTYLRRREKGTISILNTYHYDTISCGSSRPMLVGVRTRAYQDIPDHLVGGVPVPQSGTGISLFARRCMIVSTSLSSCPRNWRTLRREVVNCSLFLLREVSDMVAGAFALSRSKNIDRYGGHLYAFVQVCNTTLVCTSSMIQDPIHAIMPLLLCIPSRSSPLTP